MTKYVKGENKFSVPAESFAVQATSEFTLNYSVNGKNWKANDEATPANEPLVIKTTVKGLWYKLVGNTDSKTIVRY